MCLGYVLYRVIHIHLFAVVRDLHDFDSTQATGDEMHLFMMKVGHFLVSSPFGDGLPSGEPLKISC